MRVEGAGGVEGMDGDGEWGVPESFDEGAGFERRMIC